MRLFFAILLLCLPCLAAAAPVTIEVHGADGKPLAGAVVEVQVRAPASGASLPGPFMMEQKNIAFQPHVLIVPVGASVSFPNRDAVRHHVYSFSAPKKFELKLYGQQDTRSVVFDKAGVVALGCNIHDTMSGFIIVSPTPYAAQTNAQGRVSFANVPAGAATLVVWHPSIRQPDNMQAQPASVGGGGLNATVSVKR